MISSKTVPPRDRRLAFLEAVLEPARAIVPAQVLERVPVIFLALPATDRVSAPVIPATDLEPLATDRVSDLETLATDLEPLATDRASDLETLATDPAHPATDLASARATDPVLVITQGIVLQVLGLLVGVLPALARPAIGRPVIARHAPDIFPLTVRVTGAGTPAIAGDGTLTDVTGGPGPPQARSPAG